MSMEMKLANAKEVDIFSSLSQEEKMEADLLADIAIQIHTRRMELGMSQAEFAKFNHVTQAMVSKWESGEYNFSIHKLAEVFANIGLSFTVDIGKKLEVHAVCPAVAKQTDKWQTQTTSSKKWSEKTLSHAVYMTTV